MRTVARPQLRHASDRGSGYTPLAMGKSGRDRLGSRPAWRCLCKARGPADRVALVHLVPCERRRRAAAALAFVPLRSSAASGNGATRRAAPCRRKRWLRIPVLSTLSGGIRTYGPVRAHPDDQPLARRGTSQRDDHVVGERCGRSVAPNGDCLDRRAEELRRPLRAPLPYRPGSVSSLPVRTPSPACSRCGSCSRCRSQRWRRSAAQTCWRSRRSARSPPATRRGTPRTPRCCRTGTDGAGTRSRRRAGSGSSGSSGRPASAGRAWSRAADHPTARPRSRRRSR